MDSFEFTLEPRFRSHLVIRGVVAFVVGIILLIAAKADPGGPELALFVASMVAAAGYAVLWFARMRFVTRISSEGIEAVWGARAGNGVAVQAGQGRGWG